MNLYIFLFLVLLRVYFAFGWFCVLMSDSLFTKSENELYTCIFHEHK